MKISKLAALAAAVAAVGGVAAASASAPGVAPAAKPGTVSSARFDEPQQNAYFPLRSGTMSRFRGSEDGERYRERVVVTHRTKVIQGVTTTVVSDILRRADG